MLFIPYDFDDDELLFRAVWPPDKKLGYWTGNRITSAVFKDSRGASVDRCYHRPREEAVKSMANRFHGAIVSVSVAACCFVKACPVYSPRSYNIYHSEIHGSESEIELSDSQALYLAQEAVMEKNYEVSIV